MAQGKSKVTKDKPVAIAENQSARDVMGEPVLPVIAHELLTSPKNNVSLYWMHRDASRARLRTVAKRMLYKYDYPPDLQDGAVQMALQRVEVLSAK
jgi:type I restriction enzyme R subunit